MTSSAGKGGLQNLHPEGEIGHNDPKITFTLDYEVEALTEHGVVDLHAANLGIWYTGLPHAPGKVDSTTDIHVVNRSDGYRLKTFKAAEGRVESCRR